MCWCVVIDEHEEREDGWQRLGSTFHLHMMQLRGTCYTVGTWDDALWVCSFTTMSKANVNCALCLYWVHVITLFSLFTWKCSENSTEPALVCLFVSMLPFCFYNPCHILFLVWNIFFLITLHAVLKWSLCKVKDEWVILCVCVSVCV